MKLPFVHFHKLCRKYFRSILVMGGFCCFLWSSQPWRSNQKVLLFRRNFHLREMSSSGFASIFYCSIKAPELHTHFETILKSVKKENLFCSCCCFFILVPCLKGFSKEVLKRKSFDNFSLRMWRFFSSLMRKLEEVLGALIVAKLGQFTIHENAA